MTWIITIDVETTGLDPSQGDAVVELAAVPLTRLDETWHVGQGHASLVAPGRRVPPEARAVHHISDDDLRSAPQLPQALARVLHPLIERRGAPLPIQSIGVIAAHNAAFDQAFLGPQIKSMAHPYLSPIQWLCTWRLSQHLYPKAPSHSNQALRYYLSGVTAEVRTKVEGLIPHRALYDAYTTACILQHMLATHTLGELLALQDQPILLNTIRFGKYRGTPWAAAPKDYLRWLTAPERTPPFAPDVLYTAHHYLEA